MANTLTPSAITTNPDRDADDYDDFQFNILNEFRNVTPEDRTVAFYIAWPVLFIRSLLSSKFIPVFRYLIAFVLTVGTDQLN